MAAWKQAYNKPGGVRDGRGQLIPQLGDLPANYEFGDNFTSQDVRVTKNFNFYNEKYKLSVFAEMFNVFNRSNFEAFTLNESNAQYLKPLASTTQAYSPRMLQFGFRTQF